MKVIDIVDRIYLKDKDNFKFWVNSGVGTSSTCINWEYKDGYVRSVDNESNFFYYIYKDVYKLTDDIEIIEDRPEEEEITELPPLEYIQDLHSGFMKFTYGGRTVGTDDDTMILAEIVNRLIREIEDLKHRLEVTDKELNDHVKDLFSHNGSPTLTFGDSISMANGDTVVTYAKDGGVKIGKEAEALELVNNIIDF